MNDDTADAIGMHANVEEIKRESCKQAEKTPERLRDIVGMIDFLKAGDSRSKTA